MTDIDPVEYEEWLNKCYTEADEPRSFDNAIRNLVKIVNRVLVAEHHVDAIFLDDTVKRLKDAVDEVDAFLENETDDPRQMGWVDDRGRP